MEAATSAMARGRRSGEDVPEPEAEEGDIDTASLLEVAPNSKRIL